VAPALGDDDVPDVVLGRRSLRRVRGSGREELARAGAGAGWGSGRGHSDEEAGGFLGARLAGGAMRGWNIRRGKARFSRIGGGETQPELEGLELLWRAGRREGQTVFVSNQERETY
jgi:hypothetical protein